ncbi:arylsulfatase [Lignipirellula cremea]|uniref:Arylsulfatase n=1 Tax=Lignipirellula cremea TaxID=2528010 RepID=A0A518DS42_9BACT|nr:arylsulfatase [Lignipirellula cremea]QDU94649.1 Arylsulfatase [Lignipirellula cremea]
MPAAISMPCHDLPVRLLRQGAIFLLLAGLALLSAGTATGVSAAEQLQTPNIIYILADDLGYGDIGCYGQKIMKTPRIDRLAAEGMRFTEHFSGAAMCAPTRSCLMTGQHTGHTRVRVNGHGPLLEEDVTMGEVLQQAGYRTGVIGKWGIGEAGTTGVPWKQGFDHFFGYLNQSNAHHYYPPFLWRNDEKVLYPDNPEKRTHYSHDEFTRDAEEFIRENQKRPFFLYLAYTLAHVDLDVPDDDLQAWIGKIEETKPYGTPGGQHYRYQPTPHAAFAGMVSRLDRSVGRIVDLVDELGLTQNTLIIFTSDNGPTSAGGADPRFFDGNGPFRGIKFELYDGGIRCPMIARWPGKIAKGSETDHLSAHWDMLPTAAELAGAEAPSGIDGLSFLPTLLGEGQQAKHDYLYWETESRSGWQAMRRGQWKAHLANVANPKSTTFELYDLSADIAEATNVAADHPEVSQEMKRLLASARTVPQGNREILAVTPPKKKQQGKAKPPGAKKGKPFKDGQ